MYRGNRVVSVRRFVHVAFLLLTVSLTRAAEAQQSDPPAGAVDVEARRTSVFQQGVDAASSGRWDDAKQKFAEALAMRESPKVLFSLAQAEEHLGQLGRADAHYQHALEIARTAGEGDVVAAAARMLAELAPRVPYLTIVVTGARDATATLDGQPVPIGSAVPVDPGTHRVVVSASGVHDATATIALSERQSLQVPLRIEAPLPPPPPSSFAAQPAEAERSTAHVWRVIAVAAAGAGVLAAGIGGYFGISAKSKLDDSNQHGCTGNLCSSGAAQTRRDALADATASNVAFGVGGALVAAGVAIWFLAPSTRGALRVGVAPRGIALGGTW